jgi:hypothetical protein
MKKSEPSAIRLKRTAPNVWTFYFRGYRAQPYEVWTITRRVYDAFGTGRKQTRYRITSTANAKDWDRHEWSHDELTLARVREFIASQYEFV